MATTLHTKNTLLAFSETLEAIKLEFMGLRDTIAVGLADDALEFAEGFKEMLRWVRELIKENPRAFIIGLKTALGAGGIFLLLAFVAGFIKLLAVFLPVIALLKGLIILILAIKAPFLAAAAAVGALIFALNDLRKWFRGEDSVIEGWVDRTKLAFSNLWQDIKEGIPLLQTILDLFEAVSKVGIGEVAEDIGRSLVSLIPFVDVRRDETALDQVRNQREALRPEPQQFGVSGVPIIPGSNAPSVANNNVTNNISVRIEGNATEDDVRRGIEDTNIYELTTDNLTTQVAR